MTYTDIIHSIKKRDLKSVYLLMGDEPYYIDKICDFIMKNVLSEEEKAFNQTILYGKDTDAATIINASKRFPMMSQHQVVVVKEAQQVRNFEDLHYYTDSPLKSTMLVLCYKYKSVDKRKKIYKSIEANGVLFESKKLYEDKIPAWIDTYVSSKKLQIEPQAAMLLTEFLGSDLNKISHEIDKLILTLAEGEKRITVLHIETNIGISKEYNNLELQKALIRKDTLKAFRIIDYFDKNQKNNPFVLTITSLFFFFSKVLMYGALKDKSVSNVASKLQINPYFVGDYKQAAQVYPAQKTMHIISLLRTFDMKAKGVGNMSVGTGALLKELIYKILE